MLKENWCMSRDATSSTNSWTSIPLPTSFGATAVARAARGSQNCGLWKLLHIITVGFAEQRGGLKQQDSAVDAPISSGPTFTPNEGAAIIREYIALFFGCDVCKNNFLSKYDDCDSLADATECPSMLLLTTSRMRIGRSSHSGCGSSIITLPPVSFRSRPGEMEVATTRLSASGPVRKSASRATILMAPGIWRSCTRSSRRLTGMHLLSISSRTVRSTTMNDLKDQPRPEMVPALEPTPFLESLHLISTPPREERFGCQTFERTLARAYRFVLYYNYRGKFKYLPFSVHSKLYLMLPHSPMLLAWSKIGCCGELLFFTVRHEMASAASWMKTGTYWRKTRYFDTINNYCCVAIGARRTHFGHSYDVFLKRGEGGRVH